MIYTAERPVPDGFYDELVLQMALPEDAEGQTLSFPVIQTRQEGENAWITIPAEGEDEVEVPAEVKEDTILSRLLALNMERSSG